MLVLILLQPSLFGGNKAAGFGTTTTSAPSFGTGTGLFGNKPALTLGTGTNTSTFGKRTLSCRQTRARVLPCDVFMSDWLQVLERPPLEEVSLGARRPLEDWGLDWGPALEPVPNVKICSFPANANKTLKNKFKNINVPVV